MAELRFDCPHCKQTITCDGLWAGHQLQCPSCQTEITVPHTGPSFVAPPGQEAPARLGINRPQHEPAAAPVPQRPGAVPARRPEPKGSGGGGVIKVLKIAAVVAVLGVGGYFGFVFIANQQEKLNAKRRQVERNSDGGEMGHIAATYEFLDATEPGGSGLGGGPRGSTPMPRSSGPKSIYVPTKGGHEPMDSEGKALPVVPPVYTLDAATAKIPDSKVNGMISGTNFVAESARLDPQAGALVLRLFQGAMMSPDREVLVYLHLKPGEKLSDHTWTISKDMKGAAVPQVAKRWKPNPKFAPSMKTFATGYAMKLELGKIVDGEISGKIYLAFPDPEQSVVAGVFGAETVVVDGAPVTAAGPGTTPVSAPAAPPGAKPGTAMDRRYGTRP